MTIRMSNKRAIIGEGYFLLIITCLIILVLILHMVVSYFFIGDADVKGNTNFEVQDFLEFDSYIDNSNSLVYSFSEYNLNKCGSLSECMVKNG